VAGETPPQGARIARHHRTLLAAKLALGEVILVLSACRRLPGLVLAVSASASVGQAVLVQFGFQNPPFIAVAVSAPEQEQEQILLPGNSMMVLQSNLSSAVTIFTTFTNPVVCQTVGAPMQIWQPAVTIGTKNERLYTTAKWHFRTVFKENVLQRARNSKNSMRGG
jgi:hypothetical protein